MITNKFKKERPGFKPGLLFYWYPISNLAGHWIHHILLTFNILVVNLLIFKNH